MNTLKLVILLGFGVGLSACAPTVLGSQVNAPMVTSSRLSPIHAKAGQTLYVQYVYPRAVLDVADSRFNNLIIDFEDKSVTGNVTSQEAPAPWLNMSVKELPADWQLTLVDAAVRKEIAKTTTSGSSINVRYYEQLRVVYKVTLPVGANGAEFAELQFKDEKTDIGEVPVSIIVDK